MLSNDIKCKYMFIFPPKNLARKERVKNYPRCPFYLSDLIVTTENIQLRRIKRDKVLFWFDAFNDNFMNYARVLRLLIHELLCLEAMDYSASKASRIRWGLSTPHPSRHITQWWRRYYVKMAYFDVITSKLRRFDVITTLLLRNVFSGIRYSCVSLLSFTWTLRSNACSILRIC